MCAAIIESAEAQAFSPSNDNACYMFNCTKIVDIVTLEFRFKHSFEKTWTYIIDQIMSAFLL